MIHLLSETLVRRLVLKYARRLALKYAPQNGENTRDCSSNCSDVETLNILTRKFNEIQKKRGNKKNLQGKRYT